MVAPAYLKIDFTNNLKELVRVFEQVEIFFDKNQIDEIMLNHVLLCLDELITNIIKYGYSDHNEHTATLECRIFDNKIELELHDDGIPFDPTTHTPPKKTSNEITIGGLGIRLVRKLMDTVEYKHENGYNILVVTKLIKSKG